MNDSQIKVPTIICVSEGGMARKFVRYRDKLKGIFSDEGYEYLN